MESEFSMDNVYFAGVEGGATHSILMVANGYGEVIAKVSGDGTNHWMAGIPEVARRINKMTSEAKMAADIPQHVKFKAIGLSLSGCEQETTNISLQQEISKEFPDLAENYVVSSDTVGSILTVSKLGGMVVIAGTGSNAFLRNPQGDTHQCGGWGHALGDEGAAWWISNRAIKIVFDHEDNLEKCPYDTSVVWEMIKSHFEIENRLDMLDHCYAKFQKSFYAKLCQKLSVAASNDDELSQYIFHDAGRQLAKMIAALIPKVDKSLVEAGYLSILCVGSVWMSWELLEKGFMKEMKSRKIPFDLHLLKLKPNMSMAVGAFLMAADHLKFPMPRDYAEHYEVFYEVHSTH